MGLPKIIFLRGSNPVAQSVTGLSNEAILPEAFTVAQELLDKVEVLLVTGPGLYHRIKEDLFRQAAAAS
ncbi:hypothetical protein [Paenibacillus agricola]|uniref:Uncharacterized protein n=1 Tax=Paenibacillus agricola TaxID=2716264 RepID=A0ABX0J1Z3_9BACL|nr:hypothetical protein [Paenibacillus agricola]NHN29978.1 hypothetical protein [Paenibacillus agricola]